MKRLALTPELTQRIKNAVGEDVDPSGFAVFEAIAVNTHPLPGKDGTIFEKARLSSLTIRQMADSINGGNHLPLIANHDADDIPKGRVFYAEAHMDASGEDELRVLFYVDATEQATATKLDAGSLDEVSVSFLASQILCSDCDFDYRGEDASFSHLYERTCENGHQIGKDGVHARLVGVSVFTELSLVSRGAAKSAKIVGKSQSKLAAPLQQLAARGFEVDRLFLQASKGENNVDINALMTELTDSKADLKVASGTVATLTAANETLTTEKTELQSRVETLETELATAKAESKVEELETVNADLAAAKELLTAMYTKLAVASGEQNVVAPDSIADLQAGIEERQSKLTAILPVDGVSLNSKEDAPTVGAKFKGTAGFKVGR